MTYDPNRRGFFIETNEMEQVAHYLMWAMAHVRKAGGIPLDRHERPAAMDSYDFAQSGIFDALRRLGVETGATRYEHIDLRDYSK